MNRKKIEFVYKFIYFIACIYEKLPIINSFQNSDEKQCALLIIEHICFQPPSQLRDGNVIRKYSRIRFVRIGMYKAPKVTDPRRKHKGVSIVV